MGNIENSYWVNGSNWVNRSDWINWSNWVNWSYWVNWSNWINRSYWVNSSYWIINSYWVDNEIFCANKKRTFNIFWVEVEEGRFNEVFKKIKELNNGWFPKFNNAFDLLDKHWKWSKVPISNIKSKLNDWKEPYEAWKDMPKETIEYIKWLKEFNAEIFKIVTWIDIEKESKEYTMQELADSLWINVKDLKIKK